MGGEYFKTSQVLIRGCANESMGERQTDMTDRQTDGREGERQTDGREGVRQTDRQTDRREGGSEPEGGSRREEGGGRAGRKLIATFSCKIACSSWLCRCCLTKMRIEGKFVAF